MPRKMIVGPRGGIAVDDGGAGEGLPVVLVHGGCGRAEHWAPQLARLRRTRRALAPDLPGHGLSDPPADLDWSVEALSEALALVVDELGLDRFLLAGHSLAGNVVTAYAAASPARVAGLVLLDTGPFTASAAEQEAIRRGLRPAAYQRFVEETWFGPILQGARPETREEVLRGLRAMPRANFMALLFGMTGFDMAAAAARYGGPTLALCAEASGMAARWRAPVEVESVAGVSHWLQLDAPDEVSARLERFLARVEA